MEKSIKPLASYIDHTLLKVDATITQITKVCQEAKEHSFFSVCISPCYVSLAKELLGEGLVQVCTVVGFPSGQSTTKSKAFEAGDAIDAGADEIDMVMNIGALKNKDYAYIEKDIASVKTACSHKILKVIIETSQLDDQEKALAAELVKSAGADFVKTSTGFNGGGASVEDIQLLRSIVGPDFGVKASGGVRDAQTARAMIEAGATRIGASSSVAIVTGTTAQGGY